MLLAPLPDGVFTTAEAVRRGATPRQLQWAVGTGRLHRLRRGVLCTAETWAAAGSPERRTELLARAVALSRPASQPAFSHATAAALLGLPVPAEAASRVWLTAPPGTRTRRDPDVVQQVAPLPAGDVVEVRGLRCTSPARTVADCLRHLPALDAVPVADAALRAGLVARDDIAEVVVRCRWPRAVAASALLPLLDGRRETPLESRSAVGMHEHGLPAPRLQVRVLDEQGRFVARVDFLWAEFGVLGEADGLVKYSGADSRGAVADEKRREARLQALGLVVVRWTERLLHGAPPLFVEQLRAAFAAGSPSRFRGRYV